MSVESISWVNKDDLTPQAEDIPTSPDMTPHPLQPQVKKSSINNDNVTNLRNNLQPLNLNVNHNNNNNSNSNNNSKVSLSISAKVSIQSNGAVANGNSNTSASRTVETPSPTNTKPPLMSRRQLTDPFGSDEEEENHNLEERCIPTNTGMQESVVTKLREHLLEQADVDVDNQETWTSSKNVTTIRVLSPPVHR
ncbi:serine/threonine-protein kinase pakE-like [Diaphorina citri]|uniref:Serine/threonine-protein kinase pakE-like n=1 Tax=Diaphorina citri TaxID=121845 RepID=A0A3Q0JDY9_DIACI|nr:serine/threonine-protein kinase pakE-like [Diaphorina citri]